MGNKPKKTPSPKIGYYPNWKSSEIREIREFSREKWEELKAEKGYGHNKNGKRSSRSLKRLKGFVPYLRNSVQTGYDSEHIGVSLGQSRQSIDAKIIGYGIKRNSRRAGWKIGFDWNFLQFRPVNPSKEIEIREEKKRLEVQRRVEEKNYRRELMQQTHVLALLSLVQYEGHKPRLVELENLLHLSYQSMLNYWGYNPREGLRAQEAADLLYRVVGIGKRPNRHRFHNRKR